MKLKIKTIAVALIGLLFASMAHAYEITVTTTSIVIVPKEAPSRSEKTAWTNGLVVAQGDYITNTNTPVSTYWAITGGTSTVMPTGASVFDVETGADAIEWLYLPDRKGSRKNSIIFADENTKVYYTDHGAVADTGDSVLDAIRPARAFPWHRGDVKAVVEAGTATVNVELDY